MPRLRLLSSGLADPDGHLSLPRNEIVRVIATAMTSDAP
jgi:hypothetical protein